MGLQHARKSVRHNQSYAEQIGAADKVMVVVMDKHKGHMDASHNVLLVMCSVDTTDTLLQGCQVWAASKRPAGTH